jgi:hypothetical protein
MPFILLEIAVNGVAPAEAIDPVPSEASENRPDGSSEISDGRRDEFQRKQRSWSSPEIENRIDGLRRDSRWSRTAYERLTR